MRISLSQSHHKKQERGCFAADLKRQGTLKKSEDARSHMAEIILELDDSYELWLAQCRARAPSFAQKRLRLHTPLVRCAGPHLHKARAVRTPTSCHSLARAVKREQLI